MGNPALQSHLDLAGFFFFQGSNRPPPTPYPLPNGSPNKSQVHAPLTTKLVVRDSSLVLVSFPWDSMQLWLNSLLELFLGLVDTG